MGFNALKGERNLSKAYLNEVLESNPVPVLWLSNAIWQMEPATLRRFRLALEVTVPTQGGRRQIVGKYLGHLGGRPLARSPGRARGVPPAVLEQSRSCRGAHRRDVQGRRTPSSGCSARR